MFFIIRRNISTGHLCALLPYLQSFETQSWCSHPIRINWGGLKSDNESWNSFNFIRYATAISFNGFGRWQNSRSWLIKLHLSNKETVGKFWRFPGSWNLAQMLHCAVYQYKLFQLISLLIYRFDLFLVFSIFHLDV